MVCTKNGQMSRVERKNIPHEFKAEKAQKTLKRCRVNPDIAVLEDR